MEDHTFISFVLGISVLLQFITAFYKRGCPYSIDELLSQADDLMYEQKKFKSQH